jgi:hypothetical protein
MSDDIWTASECAAYLKVSRKYFLTTMRHRYGFPRQLEWSVGGHPRYSSARVKEWALRQIYANAA